MQTIDTAPRNGKVVIVCAPEDGMHYEMYWNPTGRNPLAQRDEYGIWETVDKELIWSEIDGSGPTHWYEIEESN